MKLPRQLLYYFACREIKEIQYVRITYLDHAIIEFNLDTLINGRIKTVPVIRSVDGILIEETDDWITLAIDVPLTNLEWSPNIKLMVILKSGIVAKEILKVEKNPQPSLSDMF